MFIIVILLSIKIVKIKEEEEILKKNKEQKEI